MDQFLDDLLFTVALDAFWNTRMQMPLQDNAFQLFQGFTHRIRLAQDINTIFIFFYHLANTRNMPLNIRESLQYIFSTLVLHTAHPFFPLVLPPDHFFCMDYTIPPGGGSNH